MYVILSSLDILYYTSVSIMIQLLICKIVYFSLNVSYEST